LKVPFFLGILGFSYLIVLVPADLFFFLALLHLLKSSERSGVKEETKAILFGKKTYRRASKYIKLGMLFGLLAFVVGVLL